jgi:hypothetical protein
MHQLIQLLQGSENGKEVALVGFVKGSQELSLTQLAVLVLVQFRKCSAYLGLIKGNPWLVLLEHDIQM